MTEQELLVDCLARLNHGSVSYYLTGSMASNFWGIPRSTHDIDFVVAVVRDESAAILREFSDDFYIDAGAIEAARNPPHQFNAIDTRSALKVDFWLMQETAFERGMFARRKQVTLFGELAWIASAEDVILHKLLWNKITPSERQLSDAAGIVAVQGGNLDLAYVEEWSIKLGVADVMQQLLAGKIVPKTS